MPVFDPFTASIQAFIDWNRSVIGIERRTRIASAAGGWTWSAPAKLPPQVVRCYPYADRAPTRTRADGQGQVPDWRVIGDLELDMKVGDRFIDEGGRHLEVVFVRHDQYAVRAEAFEVLV